MADPDECQVCGDDYDGELYPRRQWDSMNVMWYCEDHDPLDEPEIADLWLEAVVDA